MAKLILILFDCIHFTKKCIYNLNFSLIFSLINAYLKLSETKFHRILELLRIFVVQKIYRYAHRASLIWYPLFLLPQ